jgi:hypothetical protein
VFNEATKLRAYEQQLISLLVDWLIGLIVRYMLLAILALALKR